MSSLLISIITNGSFIALATLIIRHFLNKKINQQEAELEVELAEIKNHYQIKSSAKQENINKRREVYWEVIKYYRAFFEDNNVDNKAGVDKFVQAYDLSLLWGSDEVVKKLTRFQIAFRDRDTFSTENRDNILKLLLTEVIIEMRKDLDIEDTNLNPEDIVFIVYHEKNV